MAKRSQQQLTKDFPAKSKARFNFTVDDNDFEEFTRGYMPQNTAYDTQKCVKLFTEWSSVRNACFPETPVPDGILTSPNKEEICKWLCKFATEVRKKDGQPYPPKTIHHYLLGIQRHIRQSTKRPINFLTDSEFLQLRNLLDVLYRKLHAAGIGTSVKRTPVLTTDDEDRLWTSKVLDPDTPQGLLNCVFFLNGKNFCLRGGSEHRDLKLSQLTREVVKLDGKTLVRYTYTEYVSKNRAGGLKQIRQDNKTVHQYESDNVERCHVLILDKYISKLPKEAKAKDIFYVRPKAKAPQDPLSPWYNAVPVGHNTLAEMMKKLSAQGKLGQDFTNHSLRAYGVTKLFSSNVPEKVIMERSGHQSLEGVRKYERTSVLQEIQACKALETEYNKQPESSGHLSAYGQTLPPPTIQQAPGFSGCTFNNCVFQLAPPSAIEPKVPLDDFSGIDLKELLDF